MTERHTPGPWHLVDDHKRLNGYIRAENGMAIARVHGPLRAYADGVDVTRANAALLCAAPELLAALRDLVGTIEAYDMGAQIDAGCDGEGSYETAVAAIAKATA